MEEQTNRFDELEGLLSRLNKGKISLQRVEEIVRLFIQTYPADEEDMEMEARIFNTIALIVFQYQYQNNEPYRKLCDINNVKIDIERWVDIPPMPTAAFKRLEITSTGPPWDKIFRSSGTTEGTDKRSQHLIHSEQTYNLSCETAFNHFVYRGLAASSAPVLMISLIAHPDILPENSLSHMASVLMNKHPAYWEGKVSKERMEANWFLKPGGVEVDRFIARLAEWQGGKIVIISTTAALTRVLDEMEKHELNFKLHASSIIMDTGGVKGVENVRTRNELRDMCSEYLGITGSNLINEYGMCELSTQCYDNVQITGEYDIKALPHWMAMKLIDPDTLETITEYDVEGVPIFYDLANYGSVMGVQTEDLAVYVPGGFRIMGRIAGSEIRGCSLTVAELESWGA